MFKYLTALLLVISFVSCQSDSPEDTAQQQQSDQMQQPAPNQMQQPAPDVDVSDEEIGLFADAVMNVQEVQMGAQQDMMKIIQDEGLDVETYNQVAQGLQMGQSADEIDVTEEEMEKFNNASEEIQGMQQDMQDEIETAVEDAGMEMARFQEINRAVEQDPELQKKIREELQSGQMQQPQGPQN